MTRNFAVKSVHKEMYPATYNFKNDADGAEPAGFVSNNGAGCTTTIIASKSAHRKVLQLADGGAGSATITQTFTAGAQTSGIVEFWWETTDITKPTYFQIRDGTTRAVYVAIRTSKFQYYDGAYKDSGVVPTNNIISHHKIIFDCATDTYDWYIDGDLAKADIAFENVRTDLDNVHMTTTDVIQGQTSYFDAIGYSWDTDYAVGDNIFWRHFKESTDSFEGDDVGTQGTSITWVDSVDTAASYELVQEFNEHKKVLRGYYSSAAGGYDFCYHSFASQAKTGWFSVWVKTSDATTINRFYLQEDLTLIIGFQFDGDKFQIYTAGAWRDVTNAPIPADDTWYHIYVQWYDAATDTFDLWIDNIQYEVGTNCQANQTSGINRCYLLNFSATEYMYIDAPINSLDSDVRADNRLLDYNDTYTKTDITSDVLNVKYTNKIYGWRTATLTAKSSYEFTNVFFEIYDINSKLAMRGEIKNRILRRHVYSYPLRDMNWDDLNEPITNVFATDAIHDPTDSTSMLKVALPNVDQTEGDLILSTADTEAATYSPTLRNYPTYDFLRDISDLGDTVTIVKASGIVLLDDDLASGDSLDVDTTADKRKMTGEPVPNDILEVINYFEIFGAINLDTGKRFEKIVDNSGTDKKRKWRYTNNDFESQADVDAYAAALVARVVAVRIITFSVQSLGAHDMGTTLTYKYVKGDISIAQAAYNIVSETIDFDKNLATIVLSEGLIEESKYSYSFERPENYVNSLASEIYETDVISSEGKIYAELGGAWQNTNEALRTTNNEIIGIRFMLGDKVDSSRNIKIYLEWRRVDGNNDVITINKSLAFYRTDGTGGSDTIWNIIADTLPACGAGQRHHAEWEVPATLLQDNDEINLLIHVNEAERTCDFYNCILEYYQKRTV